MHFGQKWEYRQGPDDQGRLEIDNPLPDGAVPMTPDDRYGAVVYIDLPPDATPGWNWHPIGLVRRATAITVAGREVAKAEPGKPMVFSMLSTEADGVTLAVVGRSGAIGIFRRCDVRLRIMLPDGSYVGA